MHIKKFHCKIKKLLTHLHSVPHITYNVFGGTLYLTQLNPFAFNTKLNVRCSIPLT